MSEKGHNTNLAAEYHILSLLYRQGINAFLTLGNKKAVDILVDVGGNMLTIDVKGLKDTSCFPVDNWNRKDRNHYLAFVSFLGKINDTSVQPEVYIVPSKELERKHPELENKSVIYVNPKGNRKVVELSRLRKLKHLYYGRWEYFKV